MPNVIQIFLGGTLADFESSEALPLSLSKRTDKIFDIVGADGVEIDNPLESITLPATKNNHSIYEQIALLHQMPGLLLVKDTECFANGVLFFAGSSFLTKLSASYHAKDLVLELAGDGLSIWSQLEGVSLRGLDLGLEEWGIANIETSWLATPTSGFSGIFAPVLYGKTTGTSAPGSWHERDMRLHPYFYTILKGIFETRLGYSLNSAFFETSWFQRWAYVFGVGEDVKFENLPPQNRVHVYRIPGVSGTVDPIQYHNEYEDTNNEFNMTSGTTFTAAPLVISPDDYTIEFSGQGVNWGTFQIKVNGSIVYSAGPSYTVGGANFFQIIKSFPLATGDTVTTHAITSGGTMFINDVTLRIYTTPKPWQGADIVVSSCLHDEPVKKFLRAISQMFCLAWRVNNTTKQVFCEPRFPYRLYSGGSFTQFDGFYHAPTNPADLQEIRATDFDAEFNFPFGKELIMGYADNDADPLFDAYQAGSTNPTVPIFGIKKPFNDFDGSSSKSENELFVPLLLSSPDVSSATGGILPTVLPESYEITSEAIPSAEKTYKGKPTCGMVYRGAVEAFWENSNGVESMPLISQYKPYRLAGTDDDELNSGCFADMQALPVESGQSAQNCFGLASTFYPQYFEAMKPATVIRCKNPISLPGFAAETFQDLKILRLGTGNETQIGILLEISEFAPINMPPVGLTFLKWVQPTASEAENVTHNPINIAPPKPTGICCDASANVEKDGANATVTATSCRTISNLEILVNNARVYSGDLVAGTFGDVTVDSNKVATVNSAAIGTGIVTFTVNIRMNGCEVKQSVRTIEY